MSNNGFSDSLIYLFDLPFFFLISLVVAPVVSSVVLIICATGIIILAFYIFRYDSNVTRRKLMRKMSVKSTFHHVKNCYHLDKSNCKTMLITIFSVTFHCSTSSFFRLVTPHTVCLLLLSFLTAVVEGVKVGRRCFSA